MHCDHQLVIDHINDYIEGADKCLSSELKQQIELSLQNCSSCQSSYQQSLALYQMSHDWQQQEVPHWHRTSYAVRPPTKHSSWVSWSALAFSSTAIIVLLLQPHIRSNERGISVSFGGSQSEIEINRIVESRLSEYKKEQNVIFLNRLSVALEEQNNQTNLRLTNWLEKNRYERQQDIKFVMTGWQSQRYQDQQLVDRQLSYIAENQIENNNIINQLINSK
jgi:hypothetical protein